MRHVQAASSAEVRGRSSFKDILAEGGLIDSKDIIELEEDAEEMDEGLMVCAAPYRSMSSQISLHKYMVLLPQCLTNHHCAQRSTHATCIR